MELHKILNKNQKTGCPRKTVPFHEVHRPQGKIFPWTPFPPFIILDKAAIYSFSFSNQESVKKLDNTL